MSSIPVQDVSRAWAWALAAHVLGWYMQIHPGHVVLEKRKPALMDSFLQVPITTPEHVELGSRVYVHRAWVRQLMFSGKVIIWLHVSVNML